MQCNVMRCDVIFMWLANLRGIYQTWQQTYQTLFRHYSCESACQCHCLPATSGRCHLGYLTLPVSVNKSFLLRVPLPCIQAATTFLQPLVWCSKSLFAHAPSSPEESFSIHTHTHPRTHARTHTHTHTHRYYEKI